MYLYLLQDSARGAGWGAKLVEAGYELVSAVQRAHWQQVVPRVGRWVLGGVMVWTQVLLLGEGQE